MSDAALNFVITKGYDNTFIFTIKADGSTLPIVISTGNPTDTFTASLYPIEGGAAVGLVNKSLTIYDAANGKVQLTITAAETTALTSKKGGEADRFYLKPAYKLVLDCVTDQNGPFLAKVPEVYVD